MTFDYITRVLIFIVSQETTKIGSRAPTDGNGNKKKQGKLHNPRATRSTRATQPGRSSGRARAEPNGLCNVQPRRRNQGQLAGFIVVVNNHNVDITKHRFYFKGSYFLSGKIIAFYVVHVFPLNGPVRSYVVDGFAAETLDSDNIGRGFQRVMANVARLFGNIPCLGIVGDDAQANNVQHIVGRLPVIERFWCIQYLTIRVLRGLLTNAISTSAAAVNPGVLLICDQLLQRSPNLVTLRTRCTQGSSENAYYYFASLANAQYFDRLQAQPNNLLVETQIINFLIELASIHQRLHQNFDPNQNWQQSEAFFTLFTSNTGSVARNLELISHTIHFYLNVNAAAPNAIFRPLILTTWISYVIRSMTIEENGGHQPTILQVGAKMIDLSRNDFNGVGNSGYGSHPLRLWRLPDRCPRCFTNIGPVNLYNDFIQHMGTLIIVLPQLGHFVLQFPQFTLNDFERAYSLVYTMNSYNFQQISLYPNVQNPEIRDLGPAMSVVSVLVAYI